VVRGRPGRPRSFTQDEVILAALSTLDRSGPEGVTIRGVAAELGVHPTSLYVYVDSRDELVRMVGRALFADCVAAADPPEATKDGVLRLFSALRAMLIRHPRMVRIPYTTEMGDIPTHPHMDAAMRYLESRGLSRHEAARAYWTLNRFTAGSAWLEHSIASTERTLKAGDLVDQIAKRHESGGLPGARAALQMLVDGVDFHADLEVLLDALCSAGAQPGWTSHTR
jgi:AcrR family transcriptional regulator